MKQILISGILLLSIISGTYAQRWSNERHHLGFGIGASGFLGDLGGADKVGTQDFRDFDFAAIRPSFQIGYRYLLLEDLAFSAQLTYGFVSGNDKHTNEPFRNNRNAHFRSPILEFAPTLQWFFLSSYVDRARYRRITRVSSPLVFNYSAYLFVGVSGFYFNPQGYFEASNYLNWGRGTIAAGDLPADGWYNLRPFRTEGQGFFDTRNKYSRFSFAIPFGIGAVWRINRDVAVGIELSLRKTFTDYIDDVSKTYVDPRIYHQMFDDPAKIALAEYFANPTNNSLNDAVTAPGQQRGSPYDTDNFLFSFISVYYRIAPSGRRAYRFPRYR